MQCVPPFDIYHIILIHRVHYYLDTPTPSFLPRIRHTLKPSSELGEHNDFHLQKRRLSCILSIAIDQLRTDIAYLEGG
jgi:hypothetical protein